EYKSERLERGSKIEILVLESFREEFRMSLKEGLKELHAFMDQRPWIHAMKVVFSTY
ncbi:hypothetical protein HAX54_024108, partial [Datura stramonium]|nr:hypothetical protein [Datura stramonium]